MKKKAWIAITALFAIGVTLIAGFLLLNRKSSPISDSNLQFTRTSVASNENAFFILEKAARELTWPSNTRAIDKIIEWESWDPVQAAKILNDNQKPLILLKKALLCERLQVPEIKKLDEEFKYLHAWKNLSQLLVLHSISLFHEGKEKEAFERALQVIRLGDQMENCDGVPIHYLVGSAVKNMGAQTLQQLISKSSIPCDSMRLSATELDQLHANKAALTNAFKIEYQLQGKYVDDLANGKVAGMTNQGLQVRMPSLFFDSEETRQIFALAARTGLNSINETYNNMPTNPVIYSTNRSTLKLFLSGNAIGKMFANLLLPSKKFMSRKCRENVNAAATQTILAMKCYKEKYGSLPASLEQLVPEFLSAIPKDDFDGKPLRYSAEKRILYSVGSDLMDSGGEEKDLKKKSLDIPFKVEF